jgi:hypothetical protein
MQDIRQVLRRKRAQHAQLAKEIQLLEQAEEKLREVASLLADSDDEDTTLLGEVEEEAGARAAGASAGSSLGSSSGSSASQQDPARPAALRWP